MAEMLEERIQSALQILKNTAESGKYRNKEKCEEIRNAVSTLEECFEVLIKKNNRENSPSKNMEYTVEVNGNNEFTTTQKTESSTEGQVATSTNYAQETTIPQQRLTPSDTTNNSNNLEHRLLEEKITSRVTANLSEIINTFTNNIKNVIREEIGCIQNREMTHTRNQEKEKTKITNNVTGSMNPDMTITDITKHPETTQTERETTQDQGEEDTLEGPWMQVPSRRGRRPAKHQPPMTGTGPKDEDLQAAEKKAWLFIGRLKPETKPDSIKRFLSKRGITENVICEEVNTKSALKSYKVGIPYDQLDKANEADFWPTGTIIRRFRFSRYHRESEGISLE